MIDDDLLLDPVAEMANTLGLSEDYIFIRDLNEGPVVLVLSLLAVQKFLDDGTEFVTGGFDEAVVLLEVREGHEHHAAETTFNFKSATRSFDLIWLV